MRNRKLIALLLFVVLILPAFSEEKVVTFLVSPDPGFKEFGYVDKDGDVSLTSKFIRKFEEETKAKVKWLFLDISTGSTINMDALIAAGSAPDVYTDYSGRVSKYMDPEFALPLDSYYTDLSDFDASILATCRRNGKLMALPNNVWINGFAVNLDLLEQVGYKLPKDFTIAEFLKCAELIKQKAPGCYVTGLMAQNQSSEEWWKIWFYAFGAKMYNSGDYSKTTLNSPQGVAALKFMKSLVDNGYANTDAAIASDDTVLNLFCEGKIAFMSMQVSHTSGVASAVEQGIIKKPFKFAFVEMPHAPGVAHVPYTAGPSLNVVHKNKDEEQNKLAARLNWWFASPEWQQISCEISKTYPTRKSVKGVTDNPFMAQVDAVKKLAGVADWGHTMKYFSAVRASLFPLMAELYMGRKTPEAVLKEYETKVNAILQGK